MRPNLVGEHDLRAVWPPRQAEYAPRRQDGGASCDTPNSRRRVVSARGYAAIRLLMTDGETFPSSYDDWLKSAARQKKQAAARGFHPVGVIVDPDQFKDWY